MEDKTTNNVGIVKISDEVVSVIAGIAASEIDGVISFNTSNSNPLGQLLGGKKNVSKGVKVTLGEESAVIDIAISVRYGVKIPEVAVAAQESVRKSVESMTGLKVSSVNIYIQNIVVQKEDESIDFEEN